MSVLFIGSPNTTEIRNIYQNYMIKYNINYGVHTIFFSFPKVIFETVKSWYGDGEKFNRDWTYTKSYGEPHLVRVKLRTALKLAYIKLLRF